MDDKLILCLVVGVAAFLLGRRYQQQKAAQQVAPATPQPTELDLNMSWFRDGGWRV